MKNIVGLALLLPLVVAPLGAEPTLKQKQTSVREAAEAVARKGGWNARGTANGVDYRLQRIDGGRPVFYGTTNVNAAVSTATDLVRQVAPANLAGAGLVVGEWDSGSVRETHQEFSGRVVLRESVVTYSSHATHVAGTMAARGFAAVALGMAPLLTIDSYDFDNDLAEMQPRAATTPAQATALYLSNHSYGRICGWATGNWSGNNGPHYFGVNGEREDRSFGAYDESTALWDEICHLAPYYLPIKSAGNDRNNTAPANGAAYYYWDGSTWVAGVHSTATGPRNDNWDSGGYDTVTAPGTAKNILTVGSNSDAVSAGLRNLAVTANSSFSAWGPTDDGRIKPDLVGNGATLTSASSSSDSGYSNASGTSMSAPNVTGSAALLFELYGDLFPGSAMRASTMKGLILHTADDLGRPGPDYNNGWGMMDTKAAADAIQRHHDFPALQVLVESDVTSTTLAREFFYYSDGSAPLSAFLCWSDPPGTGIDALDTTTLALVHDLDLRLFDSANTEHRPWVLNPAAPTVNATTGDNVRDNLEQVIVPLPAVGTYRLRVSYKGLLTAPQPFSLAVTGQTIDPSTVGDWWSIGPQ